MVDPPGAEGPGQAGADAAGAQYGVLPSLTRNSAARIVADGAGVVLGLVTSVMAARWLGPGGKGLLASLTVLINLVGLAASGGLGDAAILWVGQKRASLQQASSVTFAASLVLALAGMVVLWGAGAWWFRSDWAVARPALLVTVVALPFYAWVRNLTLLLNAREWVVSSSAVVVVQAVAHTFALGLLVGWLSMGVVGGTLAYLAGAVLATMVGFTLAGRGIAFRPRWDWPYLKPMLKYGASVEASHLMIIGFLRGDLLLVYALAGSDAAGYYSVALTAGILVVLVPLAISTATFPRLAGLPERAADRLIALVCRFSVVAAAATALALAAVAPLAVPLLFGREFTPAVVPTLILALGGVVVSTQWVLCRSQAARGRPGLQLGVFGMSLLVMIASDVLLIPLLGINGAAMGALLAAAVGLGLTLAAYRRADWWSLPMSSLVPRPADAGAMLRSSRALWPRR